MSNYVLILSIFLIKTRIRNLKCKAKNSIETHKDNLLNVNTEKVKLLPNKNKGKYNQKIIIQIIGDSIVKNM